MADFWPSGTTVECQTKCLPLLLKGEYDRALECAMGCHDIVPTGCPDGYTADANGICVRTAACPAGTVFDSVIGCKVPTPAAEEDNTLLYVALAAVAYWLLKD